MPTWDETGFGVPGHPMAQPWGNEEKIKQMEAEINRLRTMNEDRTWHTDAEEQFKLEDARAELDRLRAENAELKRGVQLAIDADMSYVDDEEVRRELRAILAKTVKEEK